MLGLGNQVRRYEFRLAAVAEDDSFGRAREEVNRAIKRNESLGCRDVGISGTNDFLHPRNTLRAVGEGGDGLCSTNAVKLSDAEHGRNAQHLLWRIRGDDSNFLHPCDLGRDHRHQNGRKQRIASARNVAADRLQGRDDLAHSNSQPGSGPRARFLHFAKAPNVVSRLRYGFPERSRQRSSRTSEFLVRDP